LKIKVDRKEFDKFMRQFSTKGRTRCASNDNNNVEFAYIEAKGGKIKVSGRKRSKKVMVRGFLNGDIIEEGTFHLSDIDKFMEELKGLTGKTYEFTFGETITVNCGKTYSFPYHLNPSEASLLSALKDWDESHFKSTTVSFTTGESTYEFDKWFTIEDSSQLGSISSTVFNRTKVDEFTLSTATGKLIVNADNITDKRSFVDDEFEGVEIFKTQLFKLGEDVFPLFNSLSGKVTFYTYVSSKGNLYLWAESNNIEWQITYVG